MAFCEYFQSLNQVRLACFGKELDPNFKEIVEKFRQNLSDLEIYGVNFTPKLHELCFHVPEWCEEANSGLGPFSEQAGESIHKVFYSFWQNYKNLPNKTQTERLLTAIVNFNGQNL